MKFLISVTFILLSACASTTYLSEFNPIGTVKVTNHLKTGSTSIQRANVFDTCSGEWGRKSTALFGETAEHLASANESNLFLISQTPAIEDANCRFVVELSLNDKDIINLTLMQDETGTCTLSGDTAKISIKENLPSDINDYFVCKL